MVLSHAVLACKRFLLSPHPDCQNNVAMRHCNNVTIGVLITYPLDKSQSPFD